MTLPLQTGVPLQQSIELGNGLYGNRDVHFYAVSLTAGNSFSASIPQWIAAIRLFDAAGTQVAASTNNPGGSGVSLSHAVTTTQTYYLTVSGAGNTTYNPQTAGSGTLGSTGSYTLNLFTAIPGADDTGDTLTTAEAVTLSPGTTSTFGRIIGDAGNRRHRRGHV